MVMSARSQHPVAGLSWVVLVVLLGIASIGLLQRPALGKGADSESEYAFEAVVDNKGYDVAVNGSAPPGSKITWSDSAVDGPLATGSVTANKWGEWWFGLDTKRPGLHTIRLSASLPKSHKPLLMTLKAFVNEIVFEEGPPGLYGRPDPNAGVQFRHGSSAPVAISFTSAAAGDKFDADIIDRFGPVPDGERKAADVLNGRVKDRLVKMVWDHHAVQAGKTMITWDGKDVSGKDVPPGLYVFRVKRSNDDDQLEAESSKLVEVDGPPGAPRASNIRAEACGTRVSISWDTDVPTSGSVLYRQESWAVARATVTDTANHHKVELPCTDCVRELSYWITATDGAGLTSLSSRSQFALEDESCLTNEVDYGLVSDTAFDVLYPGSDATTYAVRYARIDAAGKPSVWQTASEAPGAKPKFDDRLGQVGHVVHLTGLTPHCQYVFRLECPNEKSPGCPFSSVYMMFWTQSKHPTVVIERPAKGAVLCGTTTVKVVAFGAVPRSSKNGISEIELCAGDLELKPSKHEPGSRDYYYTLDTTKLTRGRETLTACATDDYGNFTQRQTEVSIDNRR